MHSALTLRGNQSPGPPSPGLQAQLDHCWTPQKVRNVLKQRSNHQEEELTQDDLVCVRLSKSTLYGFPHFTLT